MHIKLDDLSEVTLTAIKKANPHISFPAAGPDAATLADLGYAYIEPTAPPEPTADQNVSKGPAAMGEDGVWRQTWIVSDALPEELAARLASLKAARISMATDACDAVLAPYGAEYGAYEMATWDQQYAEATAYRTTVGADVPLLAAMCVARGISIAELAGKIIANRAAWVALTGYVIGQRQRIVGLIEKCGSPEEVAAVDMTISLP